MVILVPSKVSLQELGVTDHYCENQFSYSHQFSWPESLLDPFSKNGTFADKLEASSLSFPAKYLNCTSQS